MILAVPRLRPVRSGAARHSRWSGQIFPFIPAVIVPSLLLSGLLIPFAELSAPLQVLGRLVPLS